MEKTNQGPHKERTPDLGSTCYILTNFTELTLEQKRKFFSKVNSLIKNPDTQIADILETDLCLETLI